MGSSSSIGSSVPVALVLFALAVSLSPGLRSEDPDSTPTHFITFPTAGKYLVSLPTSVTDPVITSAAQLFDALQDAVGCNSVAQ